MKAADMERKILARKKKKRLMFMKKHKHLVYRWVREQFEEDTIFISIILLIIFIGVVAIFLKLFPPLRSGYFEGIFVEFTGMLFDIVVFGLMLGFYSRITQRRREVRHQQEIIDDYKKWNHPEGKLRIAGAIRRLARMRRTAIDFGGIHISDFSFACSDITRIDGSTFYDGSWGTFGSRESVNLERVEFDHTSCRNVIFSKFNALTGLGLNIVFAWLLDCTFREADLSNACFRGAHLTWSNVPPPQIGTWHDDVPGESAIFEQTYSPPFDNAHLLNVSFQEVCFLNGDFRNTSDILTCNFAGATGLETCVFDASIEEELRARFPGAFGGGT